MQQPREVGVRPALDHLANELDAEAATAELRQDVDVREIRECDAVRDRTTEADEPLAAIQPDHALRLAHEALHRLARTTDGPVRVGREKPVQLREVDARYVVVELEAVAELALHAESVRRRNPPWYSYDDVITLSASRAPRSVSPAAPTSASGRRSSSSMPAIPSADRPSAPVVPAHGRHTAPPARG